MGDPNATFTVGTRADMDVLLRRNLQVDVDVLFEKSLFFNRGDRVWPTVRKDECISLDA